MHPRTRPRTIGTATAVVAFTALLALTSCSATPVASGPPTVTASKVLPHDAREITDTPTTAAPDSPDCLKSLQPPWSSVPSADVVPDVAAIKEKHHLTVGVDQTTAGWGYYDATKSRFEGFDVAMLTKVATAIFGGRAFVGVSRERDRER